MNASKTLTALAAAAALVGTIGYASAQQGTTGSDTMAPNAGSPADTAQPAVTTPAPVGQQHLHAAVGRRRHDGQRTRPPPPPQADRN